MQLNQVFLGKFWKKFKNSLTKIPQPNKELEQ
jgi:hypothetical protein